MQNSESMLVYKEYGDMLSIIDRERSKKSGLSYTDETNNSVNFNIKHKKFNTENEYFLRGGFFIPSNKAKVINSEVENDIEENLFKKFDRSILQKLAKVPEVKYGSLVNSRKEFKELVYDKNIKQIIHYLYTHDYLLHYGIIDNVYYGIADMIDSFLTKSGYYPKDLLDIIKSEVTQIVRNNSQEFISLLTKYDVPNIPNDKLKSFYKGLKIFIEKYSQPELRELILNIPINYRDAEILLSNNKDSTLIEGYLENYLLMVCAFPNSCCIIDKQSIIEKRFNKLNIPSEVAKFEDSKANRGLQLADYLVNILKRYIDYLNLCSYEELEGLKENQNDTMMEWATILRKSREYSQLLVNSVITKELNEKMQLFEENVAE